MLISNDIDIGITTNQQNSEQFTEIKIGTQELVVTSENFTMKEVSLESLLALGFINHPDGLYYLEKVLKNNFQDYKYLKNIKETCYVNQLSQILLPVSLELGFTILPKFTVDNSEYLNKLRIIKLKKIVYENLYISYKKHKDLPLRYQWSFDQLKIFVLTNSVI